VANAIAEGDRAEPGHRIVPGGEADEIAAACGKDARELDGRIGVSAGGDPDRDRPRHRPHGARGVEGLQRRPRLVGDVQLEEIDGEDGVNIERAVESAPVASVG